LTALCALTTFVLGALSLTTTTGAASAATTGSAVTTSTAASASTTTTTAPTTTTTTTTKTPDSAEQWVVDAIAAEEHLGSVRIDGKITQGKSQILLDLLVNGDGEGGGVFIQQGNLIKIEHVGTLLYFNAPKKFWATHGTTAQTKQYGGKWLELSAASQQFEAFDQFLDPTALTTAAFAGLPTPLVLAKPTTFAGHKVVVVKAASTTKGKTSTDVMDIGEASPHYVYKIVDDTPSEVGTVVFSHYGKPVALTVPPESLNLTSS
jgi:hypothetical protein